MSESIDNFAITILPFNRSIFDVESIPLIKSYEESHLDIIDVATDSLMKISKNHQFDENFYFLLLL